MLANEKEQEEQPGLLKQPKYYQELARISPGAALMEAWMEVESALTDAFYRHASPGMRIFVSPKDILDFLRSKNVISDEEYRRAQNLRELRNKAAHQLDLSEISPELIDAYITLAVNLAKKLKTA